MEGCTDNNSSAQSTCWFLLLCPANTENVLSLYPPEASGSWWEQWTWPCTICSRCTQWVFLYFWFLSVSYKASFCDAFDSFVFSKVDHMDNLLDDKGLLYSRCFNHREILSCCFTYFLLMVLLLKPSTGYHHPKSAVNISKGEYCWTCVLFNFENKVCKTRQKTDVPGQWPPSLQLRILQNLVLTAEQDDLSAFVEEILCEKLLSWTFNNLAAILSEETVQRMINKRRGKSGTTPP